jgi:hypothetical protein
LLVDAYR